MAVLDSNLQQAWTPDDLGKLLDLELEAKSIAFQAGTVVTTDAESIRFPMLTADMAVAWTAENSQISLTDPTTDELVVTPKKVAGLTQVSVEASEDSNPAVADQIGKSLARSIAKKVDSALFGNTVSNGPSGLLSVAYTALDNAGVYGNLDLLHDAKSEALANGAELSVFILAADVANTLAKIKTSDTSTQGLLDNVGDGVTLAGVPVLVSTDVAAGEIWGLDASQVLVVRRTGTRIAKSTDAAFDYDAIQIRGTARVAFGFANPAGLIRIHDAV